MADSLEGSASEDELQLANHDFDKLVSACENVCNFVLVQYQIDKINMKNKLAMATFWL